MSIKRVIFPVVIVLFTCVVTSNRTNGPSPCAQFFPRIPEKAKQFARQIMPARGGATTYQQMPIDATTPPSSNLAQPEDLGTALRARRQQAAENHAVQQEVYDPHQAFLERRQLQQEQWDDRQAELAQLQEEAIRKRAPERQRPQPQSKYDAARQAPPSPSQHLQEQSRSSLEELRRMAAAEEVKAAQQEAINFLNARRGRLSSAKDVATYQRLRDHFYLLRGEFEQTYGREALQNIRWNN